MLLILFPVFLEHLTYVEYCIRDHESRGIAKGITFRDGVVSFPSERKSRQETDTNVSPTAGGTCDQCSGATCLERL